MVENIFLCQLVDSFVEIFQEFDVPQEYDILN
jgi:hypothetical protein